MDFLTTLVIAVGLAMDAFAVSVSGGISIKRLRPGHMLRYGVYFGVFQFIMPLLGYLFGSAFSAYIKAFDHWVAFVLLGFIGGKMLWETFKKDDACEVGPEDGHLPMSRMLLLAVATSIDALAVGISVAMLGSGILMPAAVIGAVALVLSSAGVFIGNRLGCVFQKGAERLGGVMLIGIGLKILIEHLMAGG